MRKDLKQFIRDYPLWFVAGLLIFLGGVVLVFLGDFVEIARQDIKREGIRHSQQFVASKVAQLQNLYTQHAAQGTEIAAAENAGKAAVVQAARALQKSLVIQMRTTSSMIPEDSVPKHIKTLLAPQQ